MLWPKKNSYKELDNEKKFLRLEKFPSPPPHNFSNGHSQLLLGSSRNALPRLGGAWRDDPNNGCEGDKGAPVLEHF